MAHTVVSLCTTDSTAPLEIYHLASHLVPRYLEVRYPGASSPDLGHGAKKRARCPELCDLFVVFWRSLLWFLKFIYGTLLDVEMYT